MKKYIFLILFIVLFDCISINVNANYEKINGWYEEIYNLLYSPDWKSFLYIAMDNGKSFIVKDWVKLKEYQRVSDIQYSSNSKDYIYKAEDNWVIYIVKNWIEIYSNTSEIRGVSKMNYSENLNSFSFEFWSSLERTIIKDWIEYNKYKSNTNWIYSKDWKTFWYIWRKWNNSYVIINWIVKSKWYPIIKYLQFSPNWNSFSFEVYSTFTKKNSIVKDGNEFNKYNYATELVYDSTWNNYSYIANDYFDDPIFVGQKKLMWFVVTNWIEWKKYNSVFKLWYSDKWDNLIYTATQHTNNFTTESFIVENWIDSKERYLYKKGIKNIIFLIYSSNGGSKSILMRDYNKEYVIKDWVESKRYRSIKWHKYELNWNNSMFYDNINKGIKIVDKKWELIKYDFQWTNRLVINWIEKNRYALVKEVNYSNDWQNYSLTWLDLSNFEIINNWIKTDEYISDLPLKSYGTNVIKNWKKIEWFNETTLSIFSPDSKGFQFIAIVEWKHYLYKEIFSSDFKNFKKDIIYIDENKLLIQKMNKTSKWRSDKIKIDSIVKKISINKSLIILNKIELINLELSKYERYRDLLKYLKFKIKEKIK